MGLSGHYGVVVSRVNFSSARREAPGIEENVIGKNGKDSVNGRLCDGGSGQVMKPRRQNIPSSSAQKVLRMERGKAPKASQDECPR